MPRVGRVLAFSSVGLVLSGIDKDAFMLFMPYISTTHAFILPLSVSVYRVYRVGSAFASSRMDLVWALHGLAVSDAVWFQLGCHN